MTLVRRHLFTDAVVGRPVHVYRDRFGRLWMANDGPWSRFRVRWDGDQAR